MKSKKKEMTEYTILFQEKGKQKQTDDRKLIIANNKYQRDRYFL